MRKAAIPVVRTGNPELDRALAAVKQNLDSITAQARNVDRIDQLPANATLTEVVDRLNKIIERLQ